MKRFCQKPTRLIINCIGFWACSKIVTIIMKFAIFDTAEFSSPFAQLLKEGSKILSRRTPRREFSRKKFQQHGGGETKIWRIGKLDIKIRRNFWRVGQAFRLYTLIVKGEKLSVEPPMVAEFQSLILLLIMN